MAYSPRGLHVLAYADGFTLWIYHGDEPLFATFLEPGYFNAGADMLRTSDVVITTVAPGAVHPDRDRVAGILAVRATDSTGVTVSQLC